MNRPNAKVFHLTAKSESTIYSLIKSNFPNLNVDRVIHSGGVWHLKHRIIDPTKLIKVGQTIKIYSCPTQGYQYHFAKNFIIKETSEWVAVYKEPLITIAMDRSNMFFNLMAGLNGYYQNKNMKNGVQPITRLDYRVSGICLFSKTKQAERRLFMMMQDRLIKKRYLAVVTQKTMNANRCMVKNHISHKQKAFIDPGGKLAKTIFIYWQTLSNQYHAYHAITKTGRRHQVRFHAAQSIGSLVNDELYSKSSHDRHAPIGLIANQLKFIWRGEKVNLILPDHYIQTSLKALNLTT